MRRPLLLLCAATLAVACGDSPEIAAPDPNPPIASVAVTLAAAPAITTLVVEVTAADLPAPLVFNLSLQNGAATDTLRIPAGSDRLFVVRGYDAKAIETHRGQIMTDLRGGSNPGLTIRLDPLLGDQPIVVVLGSVTVEVAPTVDTVAAGSSITLDAVVLNEVGDTLAVSPVWASLDPAIATVDTAGTVTGVSQGVASIIASVGGVAAAASIVVTVAPSALSSLQIVFSRVTPSNNVDLYSMRGDGQNVLSLGPGVNATQVGDVLIARGGYLDNQIYRVAVDGSGRTALGLIGYSPSLAPDASQFVFMYNGGCPAGTHRLRRADVNGAGAVQLVDCSLFSPRWSPVGDRISFARNDSIFSVDVNGGDRKLVLAATSVGLDLNVVPGSHVAWSPDGFRIAFTANTPGGSAGTSIFVMNIDGTNVVQLTSPDATYNDRVFDWSADGHWLLLTSNRSGFDEIYAMTVDGSLVEQLTAYQNEADHDPVWVR